MSHVVLTPQFPIVYVVNKAWAYYRLVAIDLSKSLPNLFVFIFIVAAGNFPNMSPQPQMMVQPLNHHQQHRGCVLLVSNLNQEVSVEHSFSSPMPSSCEL